MRLLAAALLVAIATPADAGPSTMPEIICAGTTAVVVVAGHDDARGEYELRTDVLPPFLAECDRARRPEGCIVMRARITAGGHLRVGARYLARLEPAGGAQCSTTVRATALFPLHLFPAIERLLTARGALAS